jgi:hypothetical protein
MFWTVKKIGRISLIRIQIPNVEPLMIRERWNGHGIECAESMLERANGRLTMEHVDF